MYLYVHACVYVGVGEGMYMCGGWVMCFEWVYACLYVLVHERAHVCACVQKGGSVSGKGARRELLCFVRS